MLFFGGRGFAAPFRSAGGCFLIRGGLSAALPPFRLCEQREHFSCSPFFPYHGEERTICLPSRPNFLFPPLSYSERRTNFLCLPFRSAAGIFGVLSSLPFSGKGEAFSGDEEKELEFWAKQETCFERKRT